MCVCVCVCVYKNILCSYPASRVVALMKSVIWIGIMFVHGQVSPACTFPSTLRRSIKPEISPGFIYFPGFPSYFSGNLFHGKS